MELKKKFSFLYFNAQVIFNSQTNLPSPLQTEWDFYYRPKAARENNDFMSTQHDSSIRKSIKNRILSHPSFRMTDQDNMLSS